MYCLNNTQRNVKGLMRELIGNPITLVHIIRLIGYVDENMAMI